MNVDYFKVILIAAIFLTACNKDGQKKKVDKLSYHEEIRQCYLAAGEKIIKQSDLHRINIQKLHKKMMSIKLDCLIVSVVENKSDPMTYSINNLKIVLKRTSEFGGMLWRRNFDNVFRQINKGKLPEETDYFKATGVIYKRKNIPRRKRTKIFSTKKREFSLLDDCTLKTLTKIYSANYALFKKSFSDFPEQLYLCLTDQPLKRYMHDDIALKFRELTLEFLEPVHYWLKFRDIYIILNNYIVPVVKNCDQEHGVDHSGKRIEMLIEGQLLKNVTGVTSNDVKRCVVDQLKGHDLVFLPDLKLKVSFVF